MALHSGRFEVSVAAPLGHACENVCEVKIIIMIIKIKSSESCGLAAKRGAPLLAVGIMTEQRTGGTQRQVCGCRATGNIGDVWTFFFFFTLSNLVKLCVLGPSICWGRA